MAYSTSLLPGDSLVLEHKDGTDVVVRLVDKGGRRARLYVEAPGHVRITPKKGERPDAAEQEAHTARR